MKKLLIMLIVSLCVLGWRSPQLLAALGVARALPAAAPVTVDALQADPAQTAQRPMSIEEFRQLSNTDPAAYRKFIESRTVNERTAADKLMNLFAHGRYE